MRGGLMRLFTKTQHIEILSSNNNMEAAALYSECSGKVISHQVVNYWRKVFMDNAGKLSTTDNSLKEQRIIRKPEPDDDIGEDAELPHESCDCILVIPDIHAPYQHADALKFLCTVRDKFQPDAVVSLGDELDYHSLSFHDSDPNLDSAGAELEKAKVFMQALHNEFPNVLVCHSNHGSMVYRRAKAHGIPVQMIRKYRDVIFPEHGAPGWAWAYSWKLDTPLGPVMFKHQSSGILSDAAHNSCNLVVGHNHGNFSVEYCASSAHLYYGVYSGCLIDKDSLAFAYGKHSMKKPIIGCTVILNGKPILVPMVLDRDGNWIGRL